MPWEEGNLTHVEKEYGFSDCQVSFTSCVCQVLKTRKKKSSTWMWIPWKLVVINLAYIFLHVIYKQSMTLVWLSEAITNWTYLQTSPNHSTIIKLSCQFFLKSKCYQSTWQYPTDGLWRAYAVSSRLKAFWPSSPSAGCPGNVRGKSCQVTKISNLSS